MQIRASRVLATAVTATALVAAACAKPPADMAGFAGTYVSAYYPETLHLSASGHYRRVHLTLSPPRSAVDTGRWSLSAKGRLVTLRNLRNRWRAHGAFDPKLGWHYTDTTVFQSITMTTARTWRGTIELGVQPELGWTFAREGRD